MFMPPEEEHQEERVEALQTALEGRVMQAGT